MNQEKGYIGFLYITFKILSLQFLPPASAPEGRAGRPGTKICRLEGKSASGSAQVPLQSALASALTVKAVTCVRVQTSLQEL